MVKHFSRGDRLKELELRKYATCSLCNKKIVNNGIPLFWKVTIERFSLNTGAIYRQDGLAATLGGRSDIAMAMGPDEELASPFMESVTLSVCESCAVDKDFPVAALGLEFKSI